MDASSLPSSSADLDRAVAARPLGATVAHDPGRNTVVVDHQPRRGAPTPRVVTTGGKISAEESAGLGGKAPGAIDPETGEPIDVYWRSRGAQVVRRVLPRESASPQGAQVDALAFTVLPPEDVTPWAWLADQMRQFLPVEGLEKRNGCFGFKESLRFGEGAGLIAWGGASQRGRVYFSIQGKGCALVRDWVALAAWLQASQATLKRVDLAYDDFLGDIVSIEWAQAQYESDGFTAGGRRPRHTVFGDWLAGSDSVHGRTLGIGNRTSGKYCRIYEKGKQLGDPDNPWTRIEVEWHGKDRVLPFDMLVRPGVYLAGAYPCLAMLGADQSRIKTIANAATISYEAAVENARQHSGKLVNLMLQVHRGDFGAVVDHLRRDGIPGRIAPYSYQIAEAPELLDLSMPGSFADYLCPTTQ